MVSSEVLHTDYFATALNEKISNRLEAINERLKALPEKITPETVQELAKDDNEYGITLREYSDLVSYSVKMNAMYGNNSAKPPFIKAVEEISNSPFNAKSFLDTLKEKGFTTKESLLFYSALNTYSISNSLRNYNFVNAKI